MHFHDPYARRVMIDGLKHRGRITLGADKAYDLRAFVKDLRARTVTLHIARNEQRKADGTLRRSSLAANSARNPYASHQNNAGRGGKGPNSKDFPQPANWQCQGQPSHCVTFGTKAFSARDIMNRRWTSEGLAWHIRFRSNSRIRLWTSARDCPPADPAPGRPDTENI